jgi:hypothetical protein
MHRILETMSLKMIQAGMGCESRTSTINSTVPAIYTDEGNYK